MPKKRILNDLRLDKIAAVDRPCQEGARAVIIKRSDEMSDKDTITKKEHEDALAALKATHKSEIDTLKVEVEKMKADLAEALAKGKMSDDEKACMDGMDDNKKKKFLSMSADERRAEIVKFRSGDETITVAGSVVRKSIVGEATFNVLKAQEERLIANEKAIAKANDEAETARIEKRVAEEFSHVAGTPAQKVLILKAFALPGIAKDARDALDAILKSAEQMAIKAFDKIGHLNGQVEIKKGQQPFLEKVSAIQKRDSCSRLQALSKAQSEHPDEFQAYQEAGQQAAA